MSKKFFILGILISTQAQASKLAGRFTVGAASSTERFVSEEFGSATNDSLYSSQRFYLRLSEVDSKKWEFTIDARNKYDNFDKLNREKYQLDSKDEFQLRELSTRMVNPQGVFVPQFGRFSLPEAGSVFVDGVDLDFRFNNSWDTGGFAGLNPKRLDRSTLEFEPNASTAGLHLTYQTRDEGWNKNTYYTHALVQQNYFNQTERQFFYHHGIWQWQVDSRIITTAFFDAVPKSKLQTGNFIYQQRWTEKFSTDIGHLLIDVVEYQRRQNVLEKISPSPYSESHADLEVRSAKDSTWGLGISSGKRDADGLTRSELELSYRVANFFSRNWDTKFKFFNRKNFTSQDNGLGWNIGYFSNSYEIVLDSDYALQKNEDGTTTHPLNIELSLTGFFSKSYFITGSVQRAADERVTITGVFFKLGYRFGNQEVPPIRDGAAPRGSL